MSNRNIVVVIIYLLAAGFLSHSNAEDDEFKVPDRWVTQRYLGGLKAKITDNFTVGFWHAQYYGRSYFPSRGQFNPYQWKGFDFVPGFTVGVGNIVGNAKLSLGADYYYLWRNLEFDFEPGVTHQRARANIIVSKPFAGNFKLTIVQRFERILYKRFERKKDTLDIYYGDFNQVIFPTKSYFRARTTFKVAGPQFTSLKLSPYAYYEGFAYRDYDIPYIGGAVDPYYFEVEFGLSMSPIKGLSISLADQIQSMIERKGWETHQISFYIFYTMDWSEAWTKYYK